MRRVMFLGGLVCLALLAVGFVVTGAPQTQEATNPAAAVLKSHIMVPRAGLDGAFTTIDVPGAVSTACNGAVDLAGENLIVGRFTWTDGVVHGFVKQAQSFFSVDFPEDGVNFTSVNGVSEQGNLVGSFDANGGGGCLDPGSGRCRGFHFGEFGFVEDEPVPGTTDRFDLGMEPSAGFPFVGAYVDVNGRVHGWREGSFGFMTVDPPEATLTFATGIAENGIVGRWDTNDGVTHGYRRVGTGDFEPIDVPDARSTVAHGINRALVVVGEYVDQAGLTHGFVFQDGTFETVDFPDATATVVKGISTGGLMVGVYTDADGNEHGFLYTPSAR
jgi:hypothetical protein